LRAVLDPNVLIAALLSRSGPPSQIVSCWLAGEFELVVSESLLAELERALAYPKLRARIPPAEASELVSLLRSSAVLGLDPPTPAPRSADPADDYLLALAESTSAVIVTGDRHLLDLSNEFPIHSARAFLEMLDSR
jgi:putative PIN family toxin of toxin-antitoxin system